MTFRIENIVFELGEKQITAAEISDLLGIDYQRLIEKSGFECLYITEKQDIKFYQNFLNKYLLLVDGDIVIFVNQTFDSDIPGSVPIIFENTPNTQRAFFIEISDGCTGFLRALTVADSLLTTMNGRVHIVCAEKYSNFISDDNRSSKPIFSDAISLVTLIAGKEYEILDNRIVNQFQEFNTIAISKTEKSEFEMQGAKVLKWASVAVTGQIQELLEANSIEIADVSGLYLHQGSRIVVETITKSIRYLARNSFQSGEIGNTVASSIPVLLSLNSANSGEFMQEGINILSAFGIGLSSISMLIKKIPE